jgi:GNAT superfamily N-acetyltransferase
MRSRKLLTAGVGDDLDDESVWAATCFVVRAPWRGRGLTQRLLDGALTLAAEHGARVVEGYPVDLAARERIGGAELFVGTLPTFLAAGFVEVGRSSPARPVVRRPCAPA